MTNTWVAVTSILEARGRRARAALGTGRAGQLCCAALLGSRRAGLGTGGSLGMSAARNRPGRAKGSNYAHRELDHRAHARACVC